MQLLRCNPLEDTAELSYDKSGNVIEAISRDGEISEFEYDALGRLAKASFGVEGEAAESTIQYTYDAGNRLTGVADSASGEYVLDYDELDRLTEISGPEGTVGYSYDDAGRRTAMDLPGEDPLLYGYDDADRLTGLGRGLQAVALAYDDAGRQTGVTLPNGIEQLYAYDDAGQATSITYKDGAETLGALHYAYDANGRTEAIWGSYARLDLPEALESAKYNAANQMIEREGEALSYDADGNLIDDGSSEYEWDERGQLVGIDGPLDAAFAYDPFGRRSTKTIGESTTGLLHDGGNVVQEYTGEELTGSVLTGLGLDQIFSRSTGEGTASYLTDQLGSTAALTDGSGEVATTYSYEPFGLASSAGESSDNPYQFTGRENDGTGLQFNRARYYSPADTRFISPDPAGFSGGTPNLYQYVYGDPLNFTDPTGELGFSIPNPVGVVEDVVEATVSGAANNIATSAGFVWDHKAEFGAAGAAGVCVFSMGVGCAVASGGSLFLSTLNNLENNECGRSSGTKCSRWARPRWADCLVSCPGPLVPRRRVSFRRPWGGKLRSTCRM